LAEARRSRWRPSAFLNLRVIGIGLKNLDLGYGNNSSASGQLLSSGNARASSIWLRSAGRTRGAFSLVGCCSPGGSDRHAGTLKAALAPPKAHSEFFTEPNAATPMSIPKRSLGRADPHIQKVRVTPPTAKNPKESGANVVRATHSRAERGEFLPITSPLPGLSLERTTGFEPATLTLAR
jgi:hypothetical protein